jgi:hypothetical protein
MNDKDQKKQVPLRITQTLWNDLTAWANDEFRSLNGQIEFLLTECVKSRKKGAKKSMIKSSDATFADSVGE